MVEPRGAAVVLTDLGSAHSACQSWVTDTLNAARSDLMSPPCRERGEENPMNHSDRDTAASSTLSAEAVCVCVCTAAATTTWHCNLQDVLTHACMFCAWVCAPLTLPACLSAALWCELADMKELSESNLLLPTRRVAGSRGGWRRAGWLGQRRFMCLLKPFP